MTRYCFPLLPFKGVVILTLTLICGACSSSTSEVSRPREITTKLERAREEVALEGALQEPTEVKEAAPKWQMRPRDEVAPGFVLQIVSSQDEKVHGSFQVDKEGNVTLPYAITVKAAGKSLPHLKADVEAAYRKYLVAPRVELTIESRQYYVSVKGLAEKPGAVLVSEEASLDEVITAAGGLTQGRSGTNVAQYAKIRQEIGTTGAVEHTINLQNYFSGEAVSVPKWRGGEIVFLQSAQGTSKFGSAETPEMKIIKMLGQVETPGEYPFNSNADFYYYLIKAGGPTGSANLTNIAILRPTETRTQNITFSLEDDATIPQILAGDTIMVYPESPTSLEKKSRVLGGFSGIFSAIAAAFLAAFAL